MYAFHAIKAQLVDLSSWNLVWRYHFTKAKRTTYSKCTRIIYFTSVSRWQLQYYTVFKYLYAQAKWIFYRNVEPLWKTNSHFQHLRTVRTFNNRCCTEKYSAKKANDHRTTLKLSKLLIYWCFFLWHLYDLILQQVKQTLFVHN